MRKILSIIFAIVLAFSALATPIPAMAVVPEESSGSGGGTSTGGNESKTESETESGSSSSSSSTTKAAILTGCASDSDGIGCILRLVVDIMSIGIGILGVIGITIVGIQYLTAGGDEGKTRKAKQRMFEIVIGLVAYVLIYAALRWLLPSFNGL